MIKTNLTNTVVNIPLEQCDSVPGTLMILQYRIEGMLTKAVE